MRALPFSYTVTTKLNGAGGGTVSIGPLSFGEYWAAGNLVAAVRCSTNVAESQCSIYGGADASRGFAGTTTWGSTGDSTSNFGNNITVGSQVFAVWTGGDANTTAFLTVSGTKYVA